MKWFGKIGYAETAENIKRPGIWDATITEKTYYGDITKHYSNRESAGEINDNIVLSNSVSVVADPYANQNYRNMLYIEIEGIKWKIKSVEVQYPRLFLTIGGIYNDE